MRPASPRLLLALLVAVDNRIIDGTLKTPPSLRNTARPLSAPELRQRDSKNEEHLLEIIKKYGRLRTVTVLSNMATHYQTCFYVRYSQDVFHPHSVFVSVQNKLRSWVFKKEKESKTMSQFNEVEKAFMRQSKISFPSKNTCETECHWNVTEKKASLDMWAMRYTEFKKNQDWITEVGLHRIDSQTCLVYVKIEYKLGRHALGNQNPPVPSIPRFISQLIKDGVHHVFLANEEGAAIIPFQSNCVSVSTAQEVSILFDRLVQSYLRRYIIIAANGDFKAKDEAQRLYEGTLGKALVVYIEKNDEVKTALEELPSEYRVPFNHVRIFYPVDERDYNRILSCDTLNTYRKELVHSVLSAFELDNAAAIKNPATVKHFNSLSLAQEQIQQHAKMSSKENCSSVKIKELNQFIDELFKELAEKETQFKEEVDRQKQEAERYKKKEEEESLRLKRRIEHLNGTIAEKEREISEAYNQNKTLAALAYPGNLADMLSFFAKLFPQRLIIHEEAYDSAKKYEAFKEYARAWEVLTALATTLYDMKFSGEGVINESLFTNITGYEITMSESRMTSRDNSLVNLRKRNYKDEILDISPHIKWGNKPPKCLRLHFAFVAKERKILIGYFGEHIENYSTRKVKN